MPFLSLAAFRGTPVGVTDGPSLLLIAYLGLGTMALAYLGGRLILAGVAALQPYNRALSDTDDL